MCVNKLVYVHCNVPLSNMSYYLCSFQVQNTVHCILKPKPCFFNGSMKNGHQEKGCCMGTKGMCRCNMAVLQK